MAIQDAVVRVNEITPLIAKPSKPKKWGKSVAYRALICGFLVSLSFAFTQVPLVFVFRLMTCDAYYETHRELGPAHDRCDNREIEAGTARAISLLGASTTFFGVINLFVTGWAIKKLGIKTTLAIQIFWPAVRLAFQNLGVMAGKAEGIWIIQWSQVITIVGGPSGYLLALNSYIAEVVGHEERTGALGMLQGYTMFGTAIGFLAGGLLSDALGVIAPFKAALILFLLSCFYVVVSLPTIPNTDAVPAASKGISKFYGPLKMFAPQKWVLRDGRARTEYGAGLLGIGVLFGVLATGFIPVLLQLYATDVFGFGTSANGYLVSLTSLIRGIFLTQAFPRIIRKGRKWFEGSKGIPHVSLFTPRGPILREESLPPIQVDEVVAVGEDGEVVESLPGHERETFEFDLVFTRYSLVADGILTGSASFVTQGWQMYLVAILLPLASGTGPAAKGSILQMCSASDRADALSAITLVEMVAMLLTTSIFGLIFAAFANIGQTYLVFTCNAAFALLGFIVLSFSRFPPDGSKRHTEEQVPVDPTTE